MTDPGYCLIDLLVKISPCIVWIYPWRHILSVSNNYFRQGIIPTSTLYHIALIWFTFLPFLIFEHSKVIKYTFPTGHGWKTILNFIYSIINFKNSINFQKVMFLISICCLEVVMPTNTLYNNLQVKPHEKYLYYYKFF